MLITSLINHFLKAIKNGKNIVVEPKFTSERLIHPIHRF